MASEIWEWVLSTLVTTGAIATVGYLFRDTVAKFFSKAIEHRFETRLETFKAELRDNEKELEQIRSFLVSARRERDALIEVKRLEAAETLLRARHALSQLSMLVEYMKILNWEELLKDDDDPQIAEFIQTLLKPLEVDEKLKLLGAIDRALPRLYLDDSTLKLFDAYESVVMHATMMMKMYGVQIREKGRLINVGNLSKTVLEVVPGAKEGFEKFGEGFAYHWSTYLHDQILVSLRHEVSGSDDISRDTKSIERLALGSRQAQINIRSSLKQMGLPETLVKADESDSAVPSEVQKVCPSSVSRTSS